MPPQILKLGTVEQARQEIGAQIVDPLAELWRGLDGGGRLGVIGAGELRLGDEANPELGDLAAHRAVIKTEADPEQDGGSQYASDESDAHGRHKLRNAPSRGEACRVSPAQATPGRAPHLRGFRPMLLTVPDARRAKEPP